MKKFVDEILIIWLALMVGALAFAIVVLIIDIVDWWLK